MLKRKICVITASRAEYGILRSLMHEIKKDSSLILQIAAGGMHLSHKFGRTVDLIRKDGFKPDALVDIIPSSDTKEAMAKSIGLGVGKFTNVFKKLNPDIVVILGDRYEAFSAAVAAYCLRIPIAHIHGGETTEGAMDEAFRHSITKMASLHFAATDVYAKRIVRMGEDPRRVFISGAPGIDNIRRLKLLPKKRLGRILGLRIDKPTAVVTYHPVTLEKNTAGRQIGELLQAIDKFDLQVVFTMPNADPGYKVIFDKIKKYVSSHKYKARVFISLGQERYFSLLNSADLMIGNSSSGIIEAPSFKLPVVNIGDRQKGRIRARNVIDCRNSTAEIRKAISKALSPGFRSSLKGLINPYGEGGAAVRIKNKLKKVKLNEKLIKKSFFEGDANKQKLSKLVLIGGGGHSKVVIDAIRKGNWFRIEGIVDPRIKQGRKISGVSVIGNDGSLKAIFERGIKNAFIAVGSIGDASGRVKIYKQLKKIGYKLPVIKHPSAIIADDCVIKEGVFIAAGVIINSGTRIERCAIINTGASIDHDCQVGEFVHIAPKATLSGGVTIKKYTHIGAAAVINQQIIVGRNCLIGSGSAVIRNITDYIKAAGKPCKPLARIREK